MTTKDPVWKIELRRNYHGIVELSEVKKYCDGLDKHKSEKESNRILLAASLTGGFGVITCSGCSDKCKLSASEVSHTPAELEESNTDILYTNIVYKPVQR
ncbi:MAG: hypothetical protein PHU12_04655 [Candidatus Aenigmarchaeota archaeon]|nr:hypothetical protein [Candidatus Aenigmarchaeota archaeon]